MSEVLTGNHTVSWAAALSRVQVIPAYPITPQTQIAELLSEMCGDGRLEAQFMKVESEHSAMAACIGASVAGARAFTASSAQGLAFMHELLHWAAGARTPVVLANVNRAMAPPWNIWNDQSDSLSQRDTGWMQVYCQSNQEVLDSIIQAYKVSESVMLPTMVMLDAFVLSHTMEIVEIPSQDDVDAYLPAFAPRFTLDPDDPHAFGGLTGPDGYFELRVKIQEAMQTAEVAWETAGKEYAEAFGRSYDLVESYRLERAEYAIITSASIASTARSAIDAMRERGVKVGLLRIRVFRPFPADRVRAAMASVQKVLVIDRGVSFGASGVLCQEVRAAMYSADHKPQVAGVVTGLGGRDVTVSDIEGMVGEFITADRPVSDIEFSGVKT